MGRRSRNAHSGLRHPYGTSLIFSAQVWQPEAFTWSDHNVAFTQEAPLIYEAHTGMALEEERVGSYREFADQILPRIKAAGYNVLQLMAVQEHPYYGSFGYHVSTKTVVEKYVWF